MKSHLTLLPVALVAALLLAACTANRQRYERVLLRAQEQNLADDSITNLDSLHLAADYFERCDMMNECVFANYLLGCAYYNLGEAPKALDFFHLAIDHADTTRADCDFKRLSRIHGQILRLMLNQHAMDDALAEINIIDRYARLANDTLMRLVNMDQKSIVFYRMGITDSVISNSEKVSRLFMDGGMEQQGARAIAPCLNCLLDKGELQKAKRYMDFYETKSGYFDSCGNMLLDNKTYYYTKGRYCLLSGKADSALFFFRKEISESTVKNNLESGYLGLCQYYQHMHQPDSATKYALLSREMTDSCYKELSTDFYQRMQSLYNYNRSMQKSSMLEKENIRMRLHTMLMLALAAIVVMASYMTIRTFRRRKEEAKRDMQRWREKYHQLLQANRELERLKASEEDETVQLEIVDKGEEIELLKSQLDELQKKQPVSDLQHLETTLLDSSIVEEFKVLNEAPSYSQWMKLRSHFDSVLPDFLPSLKERYPLIRDEELNICLLLRLHLPLKQIAAIMNISFQNLNVIRKRLLKKVYGIEGVAKDFDTKMQDFG